MPSARVPKSGLTLPTSGPRLERTTLEKIVPQGRYQFVDAEFSAADRDTEIRHTLQAGLPENIRYQVIRASGPHNLYDDQSAARRLWQPDAIYLRDGAGGPYPLNVRLLLFIES